MKNVYFVVKGQYDIDAVRNSAKLHNFDKLILFSNLYDIQIYNTFFSEWYYGKLCSTSRSLGATYQCLQKILNDNELIKNDDKKILIDLFNLNDEIIEHNPLHDAHMTLFVAIMMTIIISNSWFKIWKKQESIAKDNKIESKEGGYTRLYYKYKTKYLNLKKII